MNEEEFKAIRHRFWRLGKEKRKKIIQDMSFNDPEYRDQFLDKDEKGNYSQNIEMEMIQRKILYFIVENNRVEELISLIEVQEEILEAEQDKGDRLRVVGPVLGETPPSKEELAAMKYVAGGPKPWAK